jgi:hypothetical protein
VIGFDHWGLPGAAARGAAARVRLVQHRDALKGVPYSCW